MTNVHLRIHSEYGHIPHLGLSGLRDCRRSDFHPGTCVMTSQSTSGLRQSVLSNCGTITEKRVCFALNWGGWEKMQQDQNYHDLKFVITPTNQKTTVGFVLR